MKLRKLVAAMLPEQPVNVFRPGFQSDRRRSGTRVTGLKRVIHDDSEGQASRPGVTLGLMKDISAEGCKLLVPSSVAADRLWVRMFGHDPEREFIECQVMWREDSPEDAMQPCGVQFQRVLCREEFEKAFASRMHETSA